MSLRTALKALYGLAWHVQGDNIIDGMTLDTDGTAEANKPLVLDANKDFTGVRNATFTGSIVMGSTTLSATELGYTDGVTAGTVIASKAVVVDSSKAITGMGGVTYDDGSNFAFGSSAGSKFGTTATQKLGFWGAVPVVQPSVVAAITTTQPTATVFGFTTTAQFNNLIAAVNSLLANQKSVGFMATA